MDNTYQTLRLYIPISERSCVSPPLAAPFRAPLKPGGGLIQRSRAEDPAEQDKCGLTDLKETLKALDDSSELICWLTELLPLCSQGQAFMNMGNQQGAKMKLNSPSYAEGVCKDTLPKSPRFQIPRKKRRRVEGTVYSGVSQHHLKMMPGNVWMPQKARRITKLRITNSPTFREYDLGEDMPIVCTPAARRKRVLGKERVLVSGERPRSSQELKSAWKVDALSANSSFSRKELFSLRSDLSLKEERHPSDSDTERSEYDNTTNISSSHLELTGETAQMAQMETEAHPETRSGGGEETTASHRVMGKIEEVEGIIRRVCLSSSDWMREDTEERVQAPAVYERCTREEEFGMETQNQGCNREQPLLVEELQAIGEALSQSLRQVLKMERAKAESVARIEAQKTNCVGSRRKSLDLTYSHHFASAVPNNAALACCPAGGGTSTVVHVPWRTSDSFEDTSPIPSPPSGHISEGNLAWTSSVQHSLFHQAVGDYQKSCRNTEIQTNLQTQTWRRCSKTDYQDDLLSSGKDANESGECK